MILDLKFNSVSSVTFSRLEPEGKLVMGFRKATSAPPSDQVCPSAIAEHFFFLDYPFILAGAQTIGYVQICKDNVSEFNEVSTTHIIYG